MKFVSYSAISLKKCCEITSSLFCGSGMYWHTLVQHHVLTSVFSLHTGVAAAFAAKVILGNVLSGISVQLSQPFSVGDMIKVWLLPLAVIFIHL